MRFITRPQFVEAIEFNKSNWEQVKTFTNNKARDLRLPKMEGGITTCTLKAGEGISAHDTLVSEKDWIVDDGQGTFTRYSPSEFTRLFAVADDQNLT
jgi:hypothetical protein